MEQLQVNKAELIEVMEQVENTSFELAELDQKQRFELKADTETILQRVLVDSELIFLGESVKGLLYQDKETGGLVEISAVIKKATKDATLEEVAKDLLIEKVEKSIAKVDREIDKVKREQSKKK